MCRTRDPYTPRAASRALCPTAVQLWTYSRCSSRNLDPIPVCHGGRARARRVRVVTRVRADA
eukprot:930804-Prymnesium_polylepis.1